MARPQTPLKAWLMLSLAVLLLHLALLQALPLSLSGVAAPPAGMTFAMRTVSPEPVPNRVPTPALAPKPKPKPVARVAALPPPPMPAENISTAPAQDATPSTPAGIASAPETEPPAPVLAATPPEPTPAPEPDPTPAPPPPRDKAPGFSAEALPGSAKLVYKVETNKFPYSANSELLWAQNGDQYLASLSVGALGLTRSQNSRGQIGEQGLEPERFSDKFHSEVAAHFNREQGKVTFSANTPDAPLLSGAQDRLSVLIQLASLVASAPERFTAGTTLTIQTIGPRDADLWLFTVGTQETLELPGGTVQGLKLTRNPRQPYDQQVEIWLAPTLGYLPARIRITETNGDYIDQKWVSSEATGMP